MAQIIAPHKLEAIAEAITKYSGYLDPASAPYAARNPGALKATSLRHKKDEHGNRVFNSVLDGMRALLYDLELKLLGNARARLTPENTLADLAAAFGKPNTEAQAWARFLRQALHDESISAKTQLKVFLEGEK